MNILSQLPMSLMLLCFALIFADIVMGAAKALKAQDPENPYRLQRLADAFISKGFPFGITIIVLAVLRAAAVDTEYSVWATSALYGAAGTMCLSLLGSVVENINAVLGTKISLPTSS